MLSTYCIVLYCIVKPGVMPGFYFINPKVEGYSIAQPFAAAQPKPRARVPICYQSPYNPKQQARLMSAWHRPLIMDPLQASVRSFARDAPQRPAPAKQEATAVGGCSRIQQ